MTKNPDPVIKLIDKFGKIRPLSDLNSEIMREVVFHSNGNMSEAARALGIGRSTLYRLRNDWDIG